MEKGISHSLFFTMWFVLLAFVIFYNRVDHRVFFQERINMGEKFYQWSGMAQNVSPDGSTIFFPIYKQVSVAGMGE